jgi:hypothetical protein
VTRRIEVSTGYTPRPLQLEIHRSLKRFSVLVCHRRFGKTVLCVNELIDRALRSKKPRPRYAYLAPFYRQAKAVAWDYLRAYTQAIPGTAKNEAELRVDLPNGARIQLFGADNYDALRGIYLDGVVLDEYAQMPPKAWSEVIRPALADREGWAIFIGTPKGRNAFCELYEEAKRDESWFGALYRASETNIIAASELAKARAQMTEEEYEQEFECSFQAALVGAYYGGLMQQADREGRVCGVAWEPKARVDTAWDLGIGDSTAIWFCQQVGREVRIVDYYEASGVGIDHYAKVLGQKSYLYGEHILPHDAGNNQLATGKSLLDTLRALGIRGRVLQRGDLEDGINAARLLIPKCWFDAVKCARGIEALRQYRREWDEKGQVFKPRPLHDWTSHAADAFRYLAVGLKPAGHVRRPVHVETGMNYDPNAWQRAH